MRTPFSIIGTIPVSGLGWATGTIPLVRARTLSITTRLTFGGAIDADATVYVFYSPDGNNWDSESLTSWAITFTINATKQITKIIDVPEHGYIWTKVLNGSSADVLTNVKQWYTIQSWDEVDAAMRMDLYKKVLEREKQEETGQL